MRTPAQTALSLLTACLAVLLSGCATLTGTATQSISVVVVDAQDRPVGDMRCRLWNFSAQYHGNAPMFGVMVRRSSTDLNIECSNGQQMARATAVSRSNRLGSYAQVVLPGGTAMMAVDHFSGYLYSYPSSMRLRVGEHIVFDASHQEPGRPTRGMQAETLR
jgi:hypothetical protein